MFFFSGWIAVAKAWSTVFLPFGKLGQAALASTTKGLGLSAEKRGGSGIWFTLPKTNSLHLKIDGWNTTVDGWNPAPPRMYETL